MKPTPARPEKWMYEVDIQVLIEPMNGTGFRASALTLSAEATTEEEAVARLKGQLLQRMAAGAKVLTMPMPTQPAWAAHVSKLPLDDPIVQDYMESLAEIRRKADEVENPV